MSLDSCRVPAVYLACLLYLTAAAYLISREILHFELATLFLQLVLLLPTLYFALHSVGGGAKPLWNYKRKYAWFAIGVFVIACLGFSFYIGQGVVFADESSYKFQAELFSSLHTMGYPPPGSTAVPSQVPPPLAFKHLILSTSGWFSKYPIGWPLVLAIGERVNAGWAATPLLGGLLLMITATVAREAFGGEAVFPSVLLAILSPYVFSYSVGRLSHALCAVLISLAVLFYLRGIRTERIANFVFMYIALIASYHVRPFSAFIVSVVLGSGLILHYAGTRAMLVRMSLLSLAAAVVALGSVLLYNFSFTGQMLTSPYALYDGTAIPTDIQVTPMKVVRNIVKIRRASIQTTLLFTFPFVFALAFYGYWLHRRSPAAIILAVIFPAILLAHFFQVFGSTPIVGERYYYEGYFSVVILAAVGLQALLQKLQTPRRVVTQVAAALAMVQIGMTIVGLREIAKVGKPYREVQKVALAEQGCHCAVFLQSTNDLFYYSSNLNLNTPAWRSSNVFYLNDPGPAGRGDWAARFGWDHWVVVSYDLRKQKANISRTYDAKSDDGPMSR